jgi:hypothetical protein
MKLLLYPVLSDISNIVLFEVSQASPACPSAKSTIMMKMSIEHWWNDTDKGKVGTRKGTCPSATLSTTNPICPGMGSNQDLHGERSATNRLSSYTALNMSIFK